MLWLLGSGAVKSSNGAIASRGKLIMFGVAGREDFSLDLYKTITKAGEGQAKNKEKTEFNCILE